MDPLRSHHSHVRPRQAQAPRVTRHKPRRLLRLLLCGSLILNPAITRAQPPAATQLPTGEQVVGGQASITRQNSTMNITQGSQRAAIDWQSFDIGRQAQVNFLQPSASSVALNRVQGGSPSQIFGQLNANGQIFLSNPSGIVFAPGASIDVGGLVATTHTMSVDDFMAGKNTLTRNGATGRILNEGTLQAALGGYIALLAPEVRNDGVIIAELGTVALAAGEAYELTFARERSLTGIRIDPTELQTVVDNKHAIVAPGGLIILSAHAANQLHGSVVRHDGVLSASSLVSQGGRIMLEGDDIALGAESSILATGTTGGGDVLIGGDWQGAGDMRQATTVAMEEGASIDASAIDSGDGGKIVLWSDIKNTDSMTSVSGTLTAHGGVNGGDGGAIETSGHDLQIEDTASVNAGKGGQWLLDPYNIVIDEVGGDVSGTTIETSLNAGTSVTLDTSDQDDGESGDIFLRDQIDATGTGSLTLRADRDIIIGEELVRVTGAGADINLLAKRNIVEEFSSEDIHLETGTGNLVLASDSDGTSGGVIDLRSTGDFTFRTSGGNISIGGGNEAASGYAQGFNNDHHEALFFGDANSLTIASGGGDISLRGRSATVNASSGNGAFGVGMTSINNAIIDSGTGAILIHGISQQPNVSNSIGQGIRIDGGGNTTITSAKTAADAIQIIGDASASASGKGFGIEVDTNLYVHATGDGGGVLIDGTAGTQVNSDVVLLARTHEFLANGGPISLVGGKATGYLAISDSANVAIGSKVGTTIATSDSDVTIEFDRYSFSGTRPKISTGGDVTWHSVSDAFSNNVSTSWFQWNDVVNQTMGNLTIGKPTNANDVTLNIGDKNSTTDPLSFTGDLNAYGSSIFVTEDLTHSGATDGVMTLRAQDFLQFNGDLQATGTGKLDVVLWGKADGDGNNNGLNNAVKIGTSANIDVDTNGGHLWVGGSDTAFGTSVWNGLTVGDGATRGSNGIDFNGNFDTTDATNGDGSIYLHGSSPSTGNFGGVGLGYGSPLTANTGSGTFTAVSNDTIVLNGSVQITTEGSDVTLASDADNSGYGAITHLSNDTFTITTGGGDITIGGGNETGSSYAQGDNASAGKEHGIRMVGPVDWNSGGGDIAVRGKSGTTANSGDSAWGVSFDHNTSIDSGTGTILIHGIGQNTSNGAFSEGVTFGHWNTTSTDTLSITSSNTTADAIKIIGDASASTASSGYSRGLTFWSPNVTIAATGNGGGVTLEGHRGKLVQGVQMEGGSVLAKSGDITIIAAPNDSGGSGEIKLNGVRLGSKAGTAIETSTSDLTIRGDQFHSSGPSVATSGDVVWESFGDSFNHDIDTTRINWNMDPAQTIGSLTIGKSTNTENVTFSRGDLGVNLGELTVDGPITAYGGTITVNNPLTSSDTGDIFLQANGTANPSIAINKEIKKTGGDEATLTLKGAGRVSLSANITATNTDGLNVVVWSDFDGGNQGGVSITADITTNGGSVWAGGSNEASPGSATWNGLTVGNGGSVGAAGYNNNAMDFQSDISTSGGDILLWTENGAGGASLNGIGVYSPSLLDSGAGDITLIANDIPQSGSKITVASTGHLTIKPHDDAWTDIGTVYDFASSVTGGNFNGSSDAGWLSINNYASLGGLTLGKTSATTHIRIYKSIDINGPINLLGGNIIVNAGAVLDTAGGTDADVRIESTGHVTLGDDIDASGNITVKATGNIDIASSTVAQTNGGNITWWSDSDNSGQGYIVVGQNSTLDSRTAVDRTAGTHTTGGGDITLAGGADNGNGAPAGYATAASADAGNPGVSLGGTSGSANNTQIYSGGGDILIKGRSSATSIGLRWLDGGTIDGGNTGLISLDGDHLGSDHGLELGANSQGTTATIRTKGGSSGNAAVTITGETASTVGHHGNLLQNVTIESLGDGGITLSGTAASNAGYGIMTTSGSNLLAASGDITLSGGVYGVSLGSTTVGQKSGSAVTASTSDVTITGDRVAVTGTNNINTSGTVTVEPSSTSFSSALTWPITNLNLSSDVSGLTLGKASNTATITISSNETISGPINIYGGNITLDGNLDTTDGGTAGDVLVKATGNIIQNAGKTLTTSGGDVTYWSDSDASGAGGIHVGSDTAGIFTTAITTGGGNITLSGGADIATGFAMYDSALPTANSTYAAAVGLFGATLDASGGTGGDITIRGHGGTTTNKVWTVNVGGQYGSQTLIKTAGTGSISVLGDASTAVPSANNPWAVVIEGTIETDSGAIVLEGRSNVARANARGFALNAGAVQSSSGDITITDSTSTTTNANYTGLYLNGLSLGKGTLTSSSSNIVINADELQLGAAPIINSTGTLTVQSNATSFSAPFNWAVTPSNVSELTLGKASNTANITINSAQSVAGDINVYGGDIGINAAVTATGSNTISLTSSGNITDGASGYLVADNIALLDGNITLDHASNNVSTLAASGVGTLSYTDSNALSIGTVGTTDGITATGTVDIATLTGDLTVSENISGTSITLNAGKNTAAGTATGGNLLLSDSPTITATTGNAQLLTGSITGSTGVSSLIGAGSGNFRYHSDEAATNFTAALGATGTYAIYREQPTLTITATSESVTYGTTPTLARNVSGAHNGDTAGHIFSTAPTVSVGGSTSTSGKYTAGSHTLTPSGAVDQLGYAIATTNGTLTVTPKTITTPLSVNNKVYDRTTTATITASSNGVISGDVTTINGTATFDTRHVGTNKTVTVTGLNITGADAGNYVLDATTDTSSATITAKPVTVSGLTAANKVYDRTTAATIDHTGVTFTGLITGDTLTAASTTGSFADKTVGVGKTVTLSGTTYGGADVANYSFTDQTSTTAAISAKAITVSGLTAANKVYDRTTTATVDLSGVTFTGLITGDTLTAANTTGSFATNTVGADKTVTLSGTTYGGADVANYSFTDQASTTAAITAKPITVSGLTAANKVYDGTTAAGTIDHTGVTFTGLIGGDTLTAASTTGVFATNSAGVGKTVTLSGTTYGGADVANYSFTDQASTTATITTATLTLSGTTGLGKVYDGTTNLSAGNTGYGTLSGLIGSDDVTLTGSPVYSSQNVGARTIQQGTVGLQGLESGNYALTWTNGHGSITPAPLTVRANQSAKFVTEVDPAGFQGVSVEGLVNGETTSVLGGAASITRSDSGNQTVGAHSGVLVPSGLTASNYTLSFVNGDFTIVPAEQLLVEVASTPTSTFSTSPTFTVTSAKYLNSGNTIVDLTGNVSATGNAITLTDGVGGSAAFTLTALNPQTSTGGHLEVGSYQVGSGTITASSGNFSDTVTFVGTHTVTPKGLTVANNAVSKTYDRTTAITDLTLGLTGLASDDVVTVTGTGTYATMQAGTGLSYTLNNLALAGTDADNYFLTGGSSVSKTNGVITAKNLTRQDLMATNRVYNGGTAATLANGGTLVGVVAGDTVTSDTSGATAVFDNKNVGTNKTVSVTGLGLNGAQASNYTVNATDHTTAAITRLAAVTWTGGTTGNWFDPANWAGGAVPDLANVAAVTIPTGVVVTFNESSVVAPAEAGTVAITRLGTAGGLAIEQGTLAVGTGGVTLDTLEQTGGTLTSVGDLTLGQFTQTSGATSTQGQFTTTEGYDQSGTGTVTVGGTTTLTDTSGGLRLGNLSSTGPLVVTSTDGAITQTPNTGLTASSTSHFTAQVGGQPADIRLMNTGNDFLGLVHLTGRNVNIVDGNGGLQVGTVTATGALTLTGVDRVSSELDTSVVNTVGGITSQTEVNVIPPVGSPASLPVASQEVLTTTTTASSTGTSLPNAAPTLVSLTPPAPPSVIIQEVIQASPYGPGLVTIALPHQQVLDNTELVVLVPKSSLDTLGAEPHTVTALMQGQPLPTWITYEAAAGQFRLTTPPLQAFPLEITIQAGTQQLLVVFSEYTS